MRLTSAWHIWPRLSRGSTRSGPHRRWFDFAARSWPARVSSAFVLTLIVTNLLSAEPPVAIGILVTLAVLTIPVVRRSVRIFPDYALLAVAFVFTCILIGAALFPPRFPHAIAQLENGTQVQGGLIAHDGGAWYVTTKRHRYVAIEDSMISKPVRVTSARRSRLKPVAAYIWNSITEDAICGMTPGRPSSACSGRHSARTSRRAA